MDDEQIELVIENVKKGDIQQFGQIVIYFQKKLFNYIYCIVNNTQDAEDILQDTFVTAFGKIYQYKDNTVFSAWLYRIARNLAYDTLKKHKRFILFERNDIENMLENSSMDLPMYDGIDQKIHDVFKRMSFAEKNILVLRIYEEKSYEEIAYITNIGQSASRKQYERARKKFIKLYNELNAKELSVKENNFHTPLFESVQSTQMGAKCERKNFHTPLFESVQSTQMGAKCERKNFHADVCENLEGEL